MSLEPDNRSITLLWGPPCAGKSTLVGELAERGDVVLDPDLLHAALSGLGPHDHDSTVTHFVRAAWDEVLRQLQTQPDARGWVIAGVPPERSATSCPRPAHPPGSSTPTARPATPVPPTPEGRTRGTTTSTAGTTSTSQTSP